VDLFELPPLFIVLVLAVVMFIVVSAMSGRRPARGAMRICRACGASHPGFARFCRKCGRQL
jgi:hypothetical protein